MTVTEKELEEIAQAGSLRKKAVAYDDGTNPEIFSSAKIARILKAAGNFRVNYAQTVIQSVHDRLEVEAITTTPKSSFDRIKVEWDENDLDSVLDDSIRDALVAGDHYIIVWPGQEEGTVDVIAHSSENVRVWYDDSTPRKPIRAVKVWKDGDKWRVWECDSEQVTRWVTKGTELKAELLEPYEPGEEGEDGYVPATELNPFKEPPVVHFRTRRPYGRPEHKNAFGPQDAINKIISSMMATLDYQAFPQRYALEELGKVDSGASLWDDDDDNDASTGDKERPKYNAGPGEVWWMNAKGVGQFTPAEADAFLKPLSSQIEAMASTTQTPVFHLVAGPQSPSGEERRASESPLMAKVRRRMRSFDTSIIRLVKLIGVALGIEIESVEVRWADPSRLDDKSKWETAKAKQDAGVPRKQALLEAGYDSETVDKWENEGLLKAPLPPSEPTNTGIPPGGPTDKGEP